MDVFQHASESQSFKIHLLFCSFFTCPIRLLSRNILREVSLYIGNSVLFPVIFQSTLRLYSLGRRAVIKEIQLSERFPLVSHFCMISELQVFCLHDAAAFELRIDTFSLNSLPAMRNNRFKPGITSLNCIVYVFGGLGQSSNERLPQGDQWSLIANSKERSALTPAVHKDEIYLWFNKDGKDGIEAYNPVSDQFRTYLDWKIYCENLRNAVLVVNDEEVVFLTVDGGVVRKRNSDKRPVSAGNCCPKGWSKAEMNPIPYGNSVYWTSYGNVIEFNPHRDIVSEIYHNIES